MKPNFDLIKTICDCTEFYVISNNLSNKATNSYSRFWEYEFDSNGFKLEKHFEPESAYCKIPKATKIEIYALKFI